MDKEYTDTDTLGLSLSTNYLEVKPEHSVSKTLVNTYMATLNYVKQLTYLTANASLFAGVNKIKIHNVNAKGYFYHSKMEGASVGVSKSFLVSKIYISPSLSFSGSYSQDNAYKDNTGIYFKSKTSKSAQTSFSISHSYTIVTENEDQHTLSFSPSVSFNHTTKPGTIAFSINPDVIQIVPNRPHPLTYNLGAGYSLVHKNVSFNLDYNLQLKSKFVGQSLSLRLGIKF
jgi:outer membrane autotransporter protein